MKRILLSIYCICFFSVLTSAQVSSGIKGREFWLKAPIPIMSDCKLIVSNVGIISTDNTCNYLYTDHAGVYKIKIIGLKKKKKWTKIRFQQAGQKESISLYFQTDSEKNLKAVFDIVFSETEFEPKSENACRVGITKLELFRCWGFPSSITKDGNREIYRYGLEFGGDVDGYDIATVIIEKNKVISISGIV